MLQPVAPALRQQPDALGEPSGEALDVTNFADIFSPTVAPHFALLCFIVDHIKYIWIKNNFKMMGNLIARKSTYGVNAQLRLRDAKEPAMPTV